MSLLRTPRNPKSPRGFQPLDDGINEDDVGAHIDKSGVTLLSSAGIAGRRKKHHFNFLSRSSKKRASAVSWSVFAYVYIFMLAIDSFRYIVTFAQCDEIDDMHGICGASFVPSPLTDIFFSSCHTARISKLRPRQSRD